MHGQGLVLIADGTVEIDHGTDERGFEYPHTAKIQKVNGVITTHRIVAQVRITMNHAIVIEWYIPSAKHIGGDGIAGLCVRLNE